MTNLQEQMRDFIRERAAQHDRIVIGEEPAPPCFTCKAPSTQYRMTPAGYMAYQCDRHAHHTCWGSDCCGGRVEYQPLRRIRWSDR